MNSSLLNKSNNIYGSKFKVLKILVTGGAGLIGSNVVKKFLNIGHDVYVADNLWRGKLENLYDNGDPVIDLDSHFHKVDLQDYDSCWRKNHEENLTGTANAHKPDGSLFSESKKNMKKYETWKF